LPFSWLLYEVENQPNPRATESVEPSYCFCFFLFGHTIGVVIRVDFQWSTTEFWLDPVDFFFVQGRKSLKQMGCVWIFFHLPPLPKKKKTMLTGRV